MTETPSPQGHVPAPIECEMAGRRLWDYLDGRLPALARDEVQAHLATCILCPPRFAFARNMKDALGDLKTLQTIAPLDDDARAELDARIRQTLRRAQTDGGTPDY